MWSSTNVTFTGPQDLSLGPTDFSEIWTFNYISTKESISGDQKTSLRAQEL